MIEKAIKASKINSSPEKLTCNLVTYVTFELFTLRECFCIFLKPTVGNNLHLFVIKDPSMFL